MLSQELLKAQPRHLARVCLPSFGREGHSDPAPAHCTSNASVSPAPGSDAQAHPREGHRSHSLATSSAFWPSPPLPGEGAAAGPAAAWAGPQAEVCVSSSRLLWGSWAEGAAGVVAAAAAAVGGAGAVAGAGEEPPGPCG